MTRTDIPRGTPPSTSPKTNRRTFLAASGVAAAIAAAAGVGGQYLQNKRFSVNTASVKLTAPARQAPKLAKGAEISDIPGLSAFYTPNSQFYRVDTALVVPQVSPQTWQLRIHGMVDKPMTITFADLMKRPMIDHDVTLTCVSESVGGGYVGNARWQGALLADLLKEAGIQKGAAQIVMRDVNGMNLGVATDPVMDGRASLLAVGMNGQPLPQEHGFPVRVVVPGLYGYVSACKWVVDMELTTFADLMKRPMIDHDVTLTCVSESVGGGYVGNARWQGALLADLLKEAGVQKGAAQIVMRDVNGMNLGVATDPVMDGRASLLAVGMNGQPLPQEHGFPVRVVVPGLYGYVSACKWVVDMELTTFAAFDAYWTQRGWSQQAPVKTESRIDTPKGNVTRGTVMIAGVAWAQHRGVEAVEVGIDGTWHQARLAAQDTIDTWRQWYYPWPATPGTHTLQVRATDKTGYTQTPVYHKPEPNGATGYHTVRVTVA